MSAEIVDIGAASTSDAIEFASRIVGGALSTSVVLEENAEDCIFEEVPWSATGTANALSSGRATVAMIRSEAGDSALAVIYPPDRKGLGMSFSLTTIEGVRDQSLQRHLPAILQNPNTLFVCRSLVDSLVLDLEPPPREITAENFPWDHWDLIEATVRSRDGSWVHRKGKQQAVAD